MAERHGMNWTNRSETVGREANKFADKLSLVAIVSRGDLEGRLETLDT